MELIRNTNEKHFSIKATEDISESTLLFEISGEVVSLEYLLLEKINLKNKKFYYFKFLNSQFNRLKDFIFVRKKGNISFFLS